MKNCFKNFSFLLLFLLLNNIFDCLFLSNSIANKYYITHDSTSSTYETGDDLWSCETPSSFNTFSCRLSSASCRLILFRVTEPYDVRREAQNPVSPTSCVRSYPIPPESSFVSWYQKQRRSEKRNKRDKIALLRRRLLVSQSRIG